MVTKKDKLYLRMAFVWGENSYAIRRHVGCLIVKDGMIISDGYNGTPSGFPNVCEYAVGGDEGEQDIHVQTKEELLKLQQEGYQLRTYPIVLHAESNAITKLAKSGNSSAGATLYVTDEPCLDCSKLIIQAGIKRVVYCREYNSHSGTDLLEQARIEVVHIPEDELSGVAK